MVQAGRLEDASWVTARWISVVAPHLQWTCSQCSAIVYINLALLWVYCIHERANTITSVNEMLVLYLTKTTTRSLALSGGLTGSVEPGGAFLDLRDP